MSVKLVAEVGVGTVAAGVAKANADHVLIAGHDGGTGASPLCSIQSAGVPWEIGLAETQQTLLLQRPALAHHVQTDGQLKTGRDVVIAAMLGADEMGFSTAPLIATGCIMMRACHLNTCPVGHRHAGPRAAQALQGHSPSTSSTSSSSSPRRCARSWPSLGLRTLDELIGRTDLLEADEAIDHWKARGVDLTHILTHARAARGRAAPPHRAAAAGARRRAGLGAARARPRAAIERRRAACASRRPIRNVNRCVGGILSSRIAAPPRRRGPARGLDRGRLRGLGRAELRRLAGAGRDASRCYGDANDYAGKGLSGGVLAVRPPRRRRPSPPRRT